MSKHYMKKDGTFFRVFFSGRTVLKKRIKLVNSDFGKAINDNQKVLENVLFSMKLMRYVVTPQAENHCKK